jgi:hypothetical protein
MENGIMYLMMIEENGVARHGVTFEYLWGESKKM